MKFWLIEEGEKKGPFDDFVIREMIRDGKVSASSKVWHEGEDGWVAANQIGVLKGEFEDDNLDEPIVLEARERPPFLYWRRLGARWFDYLLYQLILVAVFRFGGLSILPEGSEESSSTGAFFSMFLMMIPMILMEGALLSSLGFTPGKRLLALKVTQAEGQLLSTGAAIMRSLRVWVLGMGMSHPLLLPIGHLIALWMGRKKGAPLWDLPLGYRVEGEDLSVPRVVLYVGLLVLIFLSTMVLVWPEMREIHEETMRQFESN